MHSHIHCVCLDKETVLQNALIYKSSHNVHTFSLLMKQCKIEIKVVNYFSVHSKFFDWNKISHGLKFFGGNHLPLPSGTAILLACIH